MIFVLVSKLKKEEGRLGRVQQAGPAGGVGVAAVGLVEEAESDLDVFRRRSAPLFQTCFWRGGQTRDAMHLLSTARVLRARSSLDEALRFGWLLLWLPTLIEEKEQPVL
ncbi:unnamed protein product [Prorocentrum cordatum]|uniref:Uncharacterized protein n=1 Tax=Prorocentrum cordatum TaxID=2364126 RepID=A0ABN9X031_9DINO|nr:unnamed protein product [Polarella glacialis]